MSEREGITREELASRIKDAMKGIPKLGWMAWKTIAQSLSRERRRVERIYNMLDASMPDDDPDVNRWRGQLRDKITHIRTLLKTIGPDGGNMLPKGVGRSIYIVEERQEKIAAPADSPPVTEEER